MKLLERKQVGPIYHFTYLDKLIEILKSNSLKSYSKENRNGVNTSYISFTRSKKFEDEIGFGAEVRLVIDGTKLSDKYHIEPFNYYSGKDKFGEYSPEDFEKEERIWLPETSYIPNLSNYLERIDIIDSAENLIMLLPEVHKLTNVPIKIIKSW